MRAGVGLPGSDPGDLSQYSALDEPLRPRDLWDEDLVLGVAVDHLLLPHHAQRRVCLGQVPAQGLLADDILPVLGRRRYRRDVEVVGERHEYGVDLGVPAEALDGPFPVVRFLDAPSAGERVRLSAGPPGHCGHLGSGDLAERGQVEIVRMNPVPSSPSLTGLESANSFSEGTVSYNI